MFERRPVQTQWILDEVLKHRRSLTRYCRGCKPGQRREVQWGHTFRWYAFRPAAQSDKQEPTTSGVKGEVRRWFQGGRMACDDDRSCILAAMTAMMSSKFW